MIVLLLSATSACVLLPCVERRHESGVLIVCPETTPDMSEDLKAAWAHGWSLAESHPDDLGFPWANPAAREIVMRVTGSAGEATVRDWTLGNAVRVEPKGTFAIPKPEVPVRMVTVDRSFRKLVDIQNGVVPAGDLPDGDAIYQTAPDVRRNATVITIDRESSALLRALAARYGTDAIVIRVDAPRPRVGY